MSDPRQASIVAQVAAKVAADLYPVVVGEGLGQFDAESFGQIHGEVFRSIEVLTAEGQQAAAEANVQQGLGATPAPGPAPAPQGNIPGPTATPPPAPQAAPGPQAAPSPAPAPAGGLDVNDEDALWKDLFANPDNWFDNRNDKRSPRAPDFRHKTLKKGDYNVGLWVEGRSTPQWVKDHFGV